MDQTMNGESGEARKEQAPQNGDACSSGEAGLQQNDTASREAAIMYPAAAAASRKGGADAPRKSSTTNELDSSSSLDFPAGTAVDDVARKEHKREKKAKKHKKDPEAKRKKKEKKAKKEKRRREKHRSSGMEGGATDPLLAPSEDLVSDQKREAVSHTPHANVKSAWKTDSSHNSSSAAGALKNTSLGSSSLPLETKKSLSDIMKEQAEEARTESMKRERAIDFHAADSKELEARGLAHVGETEEDRMLRLAMEESLKDYKDSLRKLPAEEDIGRPPRRRSTSVPIQRIPHPEAMDASSGGDDISLRDGITGLVRQNSHQTLYSSATLEATEVVIEDPRGNMKSQRRTSTRNMLQTPNAHAESDMYKLDGKVSLKAAPKPFHNNREGDPKSLLDSDPKAQLSHDDTQQQPRWEYPLSHWHKDDVKEKLLDHELDEELFSEVPRRPARRTPSAARSRRASTGSNQDMPVAAIRPIDQIRLARQNLSAREAEEIERALRDAGEDPEEHVRPSTPWQQSSSRRQSEPPSQLARDPDEQRSPSLNEVTTSDHLSPDEAAEIARALKEADEAEARKSFQLALQLQSQEATLFTAQRSRLARQSPQGSVRVVPRVAVSDDRAVAAQAAQVGAVRSYSPPVTRHPLDDSQDDLHADMAEPGYRINSSRPSRTWSRVRDSVVGPNNEVRTKHDVELQAQANARRLGLDDEDEGFIGNTAFNSFKQSMHRQTVKGVAAHGTGRATSDNDKTKAGAMDPRVRMLITRAINNRLIEKCNGVVSEGKEAVVYHADQGAEGGGYDVAIKVFKRIQEFKGRGSYVDGDPRFKDEQFKKANSREQLEMWAEKEYRNLLRANRSGVPVPTPLIQKENVVFMRFLGENGWPVPQLKDLNIRRGSDKWTTLYSQIMVAVRRLFHGARLVHGDLSEYNILVCPAGLVENRDEGFGPDDDDELQAVLIDFGQAVDWRHPSSMELLERDLKKMRDFFVKKGVKTLALHLAVEFVIAPEPDQDDETTLGDDSKKLAAAKAKNDSSSREQSATALVEPDATAAAAASNSDSWAQGTDSFQASWPSDWDPFSSADTEKG